MDSRSQFRIANQPSEFRSVPARQPKRPLGRAAVCEPVMVLYSGFNIRAVVALCRFATAQEIPFWIIAAGKDDPILQTDYANQVVYIRPNRRLDAEEQIELLGELQERLGRCHPFIMPSTEYLNRFLLINREAFAEAGISIPLADRKVYQQLSDKASFAQLCDHHGIPIPQHDETLPSTLPFVAKPKSYCGRDGRQLTPKLIFSQARLREFAAEHATEDFFFQEYVAGESHYLFYYIAKNGNRIDDACFSQQNLVQQTGGGSIVLARPSILHKSPLAEKYRELLAQSGFWGLAMIEVRGSAGDYRMIEANPRFWGPFQMIVERCPEMVAAYFRELGFDVERDVKPPTDAATYYFWSGGFTPAAQPMAFHSYSPDEFIGDYASIRECDLFLKPDTIKLYQAEANQDVNFGSGPSRRAVSASREASQLPSVGELGRFDRATDQALNRDAA